MVAELGSDPQTDPAPAGNLHSVCKPIAPTTQWRIIAIPMQSMVQQERWTLSLSQRQQQRLLNPPPRRPMLEMRQSGRFLSNKRMMQCIERQHLWGSTTRPAPQTMILATPRT